MWLEGKSAVWEGYRGLVYGAASYSEGTFGGVNKGSLACTKTQVHLEAQRFAAFMNHPRLVIYSHSNRL